MNELKDLLKSGKAVIGTTATPAMDVPTLANSGFDFLLFDTQHSPFDVKQLIPSVQVMKGAKATPVIRVGQNREDLILNALDAGARGIIAPMVNTKEEAEYLVRSCRYYPLGTRSNAGVSGEWGEYSASTPRDTMTSQDYRNYLDMANEQLVIIPMFETNVAMNNIDEILSVDGIDVLLVGPSDLSIELEVAIDYPSDTYQKGLDKIVAACNKHGVVPGMYFIPPGMDPNFYVEKGFKFFTMPWAGWATQGIQNGLSGIKR